MPQAAYARVHETCQVSMKINKSDITGLILAGGQGQRMQGQDKGLMLFHGQTMVEAAIAILTPQVRDIVISANRNIQAYREYGKPVLEDEVPGFHGPLYGILAALKQIKTEYLLTIPCDSPRLPGCLAERFGTTLALHHVRATCAFDGKRLHPVVNLLHRNLADALQHYLDQGERKLQTWLEQVGYRKTDFTDLHDAFINLNSEQDMKQLADIQGKPPRAR